MRIIDRFNLQAVLDEQRFQSSGVVSDETAIRLGHLLGVDSVLLYRVEGPTWRDHVLARSGIDLPPFVVTSKIIRVESAEVVFHNVVTIPIEGPGERPFSLFREAQMSPTVREALDRGIAQTIADLQHAFR